MRRKRKTFKNVSWSEDGLSYLAYTDEDISLEEIAAAAKTMIDME